MLTRLIVATALALACGACTGNQPVAQPAADTRAATEAAPSDALPTGALVELVPVSAELPAGLELVTDAAGPLDLRGAADLDADPAGTSRSLLQGGFRDGYSAAYTDSGSGAFVAVSVLRFDTPGGAGASFASQLARSRQGIRAVAMAPIGDASAAFSEESAEGDVPRTVIVWFRVRDLYWRVSAGGFGDSDLSVARDIAVRLERRTS